jgi:hypothetical protein
MPAKNSNGSRTGSKKESAPHKTAGQAKMARGQFVAEVGP